MRRLALVTLVACGAASPSSAPATGISNAPSLRASPEASAACTVPTPDEMTATSHDVLLSRRAYHFTVRAYTHVLRDGRLLHRADHAAHEGDACGETRLTAAELDLLRTASAGLCTWPVRAEEPVMDQGRLEYVLADVNARCTRNEASTAIVPISPVDFASAEPLPPLPEWAKLNALLDAWAKRATAR